MTRYYFHVRDGEDFIRDLNGENFESLSAARHEALGAARELVADAVESGEPPNHRTIEITDEENRVVAQVPFSEVLKGAASG
jgi:hypothetical protein